MTSSAPARPIHALLGAFPEAVALTLLAALPSFVNLASARMFEEEADDNRPFEVRDELGLRVGDPGACAFSINGRAGRPLGSRGAPVTVRITKGQLPRVPELLAGEPRPAAREYLPLCRMCPFG